MLGKKKNYFFSLLPPQIGRHQKSSLSSDANSEKHSHSPKLAAGFQ
jgi:hypothetical protein